MAEHRRQNRLAQEKSPYLLQHCENPVDWFPWGKEAIEKAKKEDKPIFLSVGYSTCHWCHVMEKESFENEQIAKILNEYFVSIKVDREERPDIDKVYMTYVQATSGGGGWPMSVWLTPDLKPFLGGTYFPPVGKFGRPGFPELLVRIQSMWSNRSKRSDLIQSSEHVIEALQNHTASKEGKGAGLGEGVLFESLDEYYEKISRMYDSKLGGFGQAPKFPRPVIFTGLFQFYFQNSVESEKVVGHKRDPTAGNNALQMCEFTLTQMFKGGVHDHVGGGFHRYSVDKYWHVPHFEKMLYDQAQMLQAYVTAYQISKKEIFAVAARDICDYVIEMLTSKEGGFYSAEDADSLISHDSTTKAEGAFYVWSKKEIDQILGKDSDLFNYHFGVVEAGNALPESDPHKEFNQKNILIQRHEISETAKKFGVSDSEVSQIIARSLLALKEVRAKRPRPFLDDKIITGWNGLMISAFASAGEILNSPKYLEAALKAAHFIKSTLYKDGILIRNYRQSPSSVRGFADDYAFMITAALDLYEATADLQWFKWAMDLQNKMDELFYDKKDGAYFSAESGDAHLVLRMKEEYDGSEPSPNSYAAVNLARLYHMTHIKTYSEKAEATLKFYYKELVKAPIIFPHILGAVGMMFGNPKQITIAGNPNSAGVREWRQILVDKFYPNKVVVYADGGAGQEFFCKFGADFVKPESMQLEKDSPTGYVCQSFTCNIAKDTESFKNLIAKNF